jgi:lysophospholipase L1-like esterase
LELGTVSTAYAPYGNTFNDVSLDDTSFQNQLSKSQLKMSQLNNFVKSKNLFNKDTAMAGSYINSSGNLVSAAGFYYSDYIPVLPSTQYYKSGTYQFAYYDSNKVYISGGSGHALTTPANCYYVRISAYATLNSGVPGINLEQLELGTVGTEYVPYYDTVSGLKDTSFVQNAVFITLPPKIYAMVGKELNIYFDNILNDKDTNYDFDVACNIGQQYANYYRVNPTTAGSYAFTITVYKGNSVVAEANSTIIVSGANVGNGVNKKILIIGDSTTDNSFLVPHLMSNFNSDVMKITSVGTRGTTPNNHEGHSGWTASKFVSDATSPFVFSGAFNFGQYMSTHGYSGLNYVLINLGINDTFWFLDDASFNSGLTAIINNFNTIINGVKAYDAAIKIGVALTVPPNYSQDAFGAPYNNDQSRKRYKRNNWLFVKSLLSNFANQEGQNIYLIPLNVNLDTRYNYPLSQQAVNGRNTKVIDFPTNNADGQTPGVHPDETGYAQIADSYQYFLKSFEV